MSIEAQLRKKNNWKLLTEEDMDNSLKRMWINPKTVKEININWDLLKKNKARLRFKWLPLNIRKIGWK